MGLLLGKLFSAEMYICLYTKDPAVTYKHQLPRQAATLPRLSIVRVCPSSCKGLGTDAVSICDTSSCA